MGLKETNQVRMVGVVPARNADPVPVGKIPDDGTQVAVQGLAANQTTTIHTVTAAKTLYLSLAAVGVRNNNAANQSVYLRVTDGVDALQYDLFGFSVAASQGASDSHSFMPPLEIPAGWKLKVISADADVRAHAFIHGYEA